MEGLIFDYSCVKCGDQVTNETMDSFTCECGGNYRLSDKVNMDIFEPYYDETLKMRIHSAAQRNKEFRKAGLYISQDDSKLIKRWKDDRKYKEEKHQELLKKDGLSYKPGSGAKWDAEKQDFIGGNTRKRMYFCPK